MTTLSNARLTQRRARRSIRGWLTVRVLVVGGAILRRLPDRVLHRFAHALGWLLYASQPARRRLVRDNLRRVVGHLDAQAMAGPAATAAAHDERALKRLVRQAFGHYVRGYLEGAILPIYGRAANFNRVVADDQTLAAQAFPATGHGPLIIVGLHFGAIEIPALWATHYLGADITAPMEAVADADVQAYFERARSKTGLTVVPLEGAAARLRSTLEQGRAVGLVADRPVGGAGTSVELFGAPARLPAGPALLALETGAPVWLIATRRTGWGEYRTRLERIEMPAVGTRREKLTAFMASQARAFERAIADAPEQWWTAFFPIWTATKEAGK